jgi:hypothetical protein
LAETAFVILDHCDRSKLGLAAIPCRAKSFRPEFNACRFIP